MSLCCSLICLEVVVSKMGQMSQEKPKVCAPSVLITAREPDDLQSRPWFLMTSGCVSFLAPRQLFCFLMKNQSAATWNLLARGDSSQSACRLLFSLLSLLRISNRRPLTQIDCRLPACLESVAKYSPRNWLFHFFPPIRFVPALSRWWLNFLARQRSQRKETGSLFHM